MQAGSLGQFDIGLRPDGDHDHIRGHDLGRADSNPGDPAVAAENLLNLDLAGENHSVAFVQAGEIAAEFIAER